MDPVCMLTIYPQLLQNFVYKPPRMNFNVIGLVDSLRFVFSRDLLVAEVRLVAVSLHTGPHTELGSSRIEICQRYTLPVVPTPSGQVAQQSSAFLASQCHVWEVSDAVLLTGYLLWC